MNDLLVTVHVLAAVLWVGGAVTLHILLRRAFRLSDARERHQRITELEQVGGTFYPAFSIILLAAGIWLVSRDDSGFEFSDTFVQIGFARLDHQLPDRDRLNSVELLILLLVVVNMTTKPGWP